MNAPDRVDQIKGFLALVAGIVTGLLGWTGVAVIIMGVCMALDYLTGTLAAKANGEWSSAVAREGLWHKAGEIAALLVAILLDAALYTALHSAAAPIFSEWKGRFFTLLVSFWYVFTELGSILENAAKLGAPVPEILIRGVRKLKKKVETEKEKTEETEPDEKRAAEGGRPYGEDGTSEEDGMESAEEGARPEEDR